MKFGPTQGRTLHFCQTDRDLVVAEFLHSMSAERQFIRITGVHAVFRKQYVIVPGVESVRSSRPRTIRKENAIRTPSQFKPRFPAPFLQHLPLLVTAEMGHSLSPHVGSPSLSAPSERFGSIKVVEVTQHRSTHVNVRCVRYL